MNNNIQQALKHDRVIDITTIGRKTKQPRRIEIWFHNINNCLYITGTPGRRSWYANLVATPEFTFHLKDSVQADLAARAIPIVAEDKRREVLTGILRNLDMESELETWVEKSPLVQVELDMN